MDDDLVEKFLRAAGAGDLVAVQLLLNSGVDVNSSNDIGYTALMSAARSYRTAVLQLLLSGGANARANSQDGSTALHAATGETPSLPEAQAECVQSLLGAGADIDAVTNSGLTSLMNAAWFGCDQSASVLVKAGALVSIRDHRGRTAEDLARAKGHTTIAEMIARSESHK